MRAASQSPAMQGFFEVWGEGATWEELVQSVNAIPEACKLPWLGSNTSMKVGCLSLKESFCQLRPRAYLCLKAAG